MASEGRYAVELTVGRDTTGFRTDDIWAARAINEAQRDENNDNRDAFGRVYDYRTFRNVEGSLWRGGPAPKPRETAASIMAGIYGKLIADGQPVVVIGDGRVTEYNRADDEADEAPAPVYAVIAPRPCIATPVGRRAA